MTRHERETSTATPWPFWHERLGPVGWFCALRRHVPQYYTPSERRQRHPRPWDAGFDPQKNPVYACNELEIEARPSDVFRTMTDARAWHTFYPNASEVVVAGHDLEPLAAGTHFVWTTFGTRQRSRVTLFEPAVALGWTAESLGTHAYHRWLFEPRGDGTRLVTEECQHGPVAFVDRYWMNRSLHAAHQLWLEGLRAHLLAGPSSKRRA